MAKFDYPVYVQRSFYLFTDLFCRSDYKDLTFGFEHKHLIKSFGGVT